MTDHKRKTGDGPDNESGDDIAISRGSATSPETDASRSPLSVTEAESDPEEMAEAEPGEVESADDADPVLDEITRERDSYHDKWLRAVAELDNLRKRTRRELVDSRKFAVADLMRGLLEVLDNFERAFTSLEQHDNDADRDEFRAGVELIYQSLHSALTERGVRRIEAQDRAFDPALHEAIGQQEQPGVTEGTVLEVVQQGYLLDDLVLRPCRVIVAKGDQ